MRHVVFLVGSYYPFCAAVDTCCLNIVEELVKDNRVTVVCFKSRLDQLTIEEYQGQTISRISHLWWDIRLKLNSNLNASEGLAKKWWAVLLNSVRAKEYMQILFSRASLNGATVKSYLKALENLEVPADIIIPFCLPMETVVAAIGYKYKHDGVKLIPYLFDPFVENPTLHRTQLNKHLKKMSNTAVEVEMLNCSTRILCVNQLKEHFTQYKDHLDKLVFTEHPLLKQKQEKDSHRKHENGDLTIVYAGVFYRTIRNPEYFLRCMLQVLPQIDGSLHLYSYGNCKDIIDKYTTTSMGNIIDHGFVPKEEADHVVYESDLLVNVGNINNLQVPSKVFEYMSAGRPIIHFYSNDDDVNLGILKNYPLCLCLKQDDSLFSENVEKCIRFCRDTRGKTVGFDIVAETYWNATPQFVASQIIDIMKIK